VVASGSGGRLKPLVCGLLLALLLLRVVLVACLPLQPAGADPVLLLETASSAELPLELTGTLLGDPRSSVGTGSCRALLQLTGETAWADELLQLLQHPQLQVRRAALMDLGAVGWRPALVPIQRTLAENSLKLIALRGLVENGSGSEADSDDEAVLMAMDALL